MASTNGQTKNRPIRLTWRHLAVTANCAIIVCSVGMMTRTWYDTSTLAKLPPASTIRSSNQLAKLIQPWTQTVGFWAVDDSPFGLAKRIISDRDVKRQFAHIRSLRQKDGFVSVTCEGIPDEWDSLIANSDGLEPIQHNGMTYYLLEQDNFRGLLITRFANGAEKLAGGFMANRTEGNKWETTELKSTENDSAPTTSLSHLIPLPDGASRLLMRRSPLKLCAELLELDCDAQMLLDSWQAAGWEVRHAEFGSFRKFSYLCVKGNSTIHAWSDESSSRITRLMLVDASGA